MSLTRAQWEEMWKDIKSMEHAVQFLKPGSVKNTIIYNLAHIKQLVQLVIGQME